MIAVGEDLGLEGQKRPAGVHEVDAWQPVVERDLLRPQVFLDGDRVVGPAFDGRVVGDDQHLATRDAADAGDQPGGRRLALVQVVGGKRRQLQKRGAPVEEPIDALANGQLALRAVALQVLGSPPVAGCLNAVPELADELPHAIAISFERVLVGVDLGGEDYHTRSVQRETA